MGWQNPYKSLLVRKGLLHINNNLSTKKVMNIEKTINSKYLKTDIMNEIEYIENFYVGNYLTPSYIQYLSKIFFLCILKKFYEHQLYPWTPLEFWTFRDLILKKRHFVILVTLLWIPQNENPTWASVIVS